MDKSKRKLKYIWVELQKKWIFRWIIGPTGLSIIITIFLHFLISKIFNQYHPDWWMIIGFCSFTNGSIILLRIFREFTTSSLNKILNYEAKTPMLRENLIKILENSAKNGNRHIEIDDTVRLLGDIALLLDPENPNIKDEEEKFDDVIKQIKKIPVNVRSTDMRKPLEWAVDNNLQKLMVNFALHLPQPSATLTFPEHVMDAIASCLRNYEKRIEDNPLGHARRWIVCEKWNGKREFSADPLTNVNKEKFANCVFRQFTNPIEIKDGLKWIPVEGLPIRSQKIKMLEEKSPCKGTGCEHKVANTCIGVNIAEVFKVNEEVCQNKSVFETCNLVRGPKIPTNIPEKFNELLVCKIKIVKTEDSKMNNFYRILLWDTNYFRSKQSETWIKFWDQIVKLPCFWVRPKRYNESELKENIQKYFLRSNYDYIHIDNGTEVKAFKTYVEEGVPKFSVELKNDGTESEANDLNINFNRLLTFLNDPEEYSNILLAAHAYDIEKKEVRKKNGE
jgi:hypothetical protein